MEVQSEIQKGKVTFTRGEDLSANLKLEVSNMSLSGTPSRKKKDKMISPVSTQDRAQHRQMGRATEYQMLASLLPLTIYVPANYPESPPIIVDDSEPREFEDMYRKARLMLGMTLDDLSHPASLREMDSTSGGRPFSCLESIAPIDKFPKQLTAKDNTTMGGGTD